MIWRPWQDGEIYYFNFKDGSSVMRHLSCV